MGIQISRYLARTALWLTQFISGYIVVCRGYNEDDINFTELVWEDDCSLEFSDDFSYPEFQIWIR